MKTVTIVVPCFNESESIPLFFKELSGIIKGLPEYSFKLLFVDDGSTDATLEILRALAKKSSIVEYISFSRNFGKEAAMLAGLSNADSELVGLIDADLQHNPHLIPGMLKALENDDVFVAATRRTNRTGESKLRSFLSGNFYNVVNKVSQVKINNNATDYRIMKRVVIDAILSLPEHIRFSKGIFSWIGFKTEWFEQENIERVAGTTKWSLKKLSKYALDGILGFTTAPLRISLYTGILSGFFGFAALIYSLIRSLLSPEYAYGFSALIGVIFFVGGLVMFFIGIMGEYISRSYLEIQDRPTFIVAESVTKKPHKSREDNFDDYT